MSTYWNSGSPSPLKENIADENVTIQTSPPPQSKYGFVQWPFDNLAVSKTFCCSGSDAPPDLTCKMSNYSILITFKTMKRNINLRLKSNNSYMICILGNTLIWLVVRTSGSRSWLCLFFYRRRWPNIFH